MRTRPLFLSLILLLFPFPARAAEDEPSIDGRPLSALLHDVQFGDESVAEKAMELLSRPEARTPAMLPHLRKLLAHPHKRVVAWVLETLGASDTEHLTNRELASRPFVTGDTFTVVDITCLICVDFMKPAKLAVPDELKNLKRWHAAVSARPSASA